MIRVLFYVPSTMLMVGAATELSHTSCLMALAWLFLSFIRTLEEDSQAWIHTGVAVFFGITFFIRPVSALGIGDFGLGCRAVLGIVPRIPVSPEIGRSVGKLH